MGIYAWQQPDWPNWQFDPARLAGLESRLLKQAGYQLGIFATLNATERLRLTIQFLVVEGAQTSAIEGEILDRQSLQVSLLRQFGLEAAAGRKLPPAEQGTAELMADLFRGYAQPLTAATLCHWHTCLMRGRHDVADLGRYRTDPSPMQIVSGPIHRPRVHYVAPPAAQVAAEMDGFLDWFERTAPGGPEALPPLTRAGIAHLWFELIHPFEDGNGRIGRAIAQKALAQSLDEPLVIALADTIERNRKAYYQALELANLSVDITQWLEYFAATILDALERTQQHTLFLVGKAKFFDRFGARLNPRQTKVIARLYNAGPDGFVGGLSAANYRSITGTSPATVTRDLAELTAIGALQRTGQHRATRYWLPSAEDVEDIDLATAVLAKVEAGIEPVHSAAEVRRLLGLDE